VDLVEAYFQETGLAPVQRYDGTSLPQGAQVEGPALIREPTTTVVIYPGSIATVTALGNYLLEVGDGAAGRELVAEEAGTA
jgi:N-methylhydantoinase A